MSKGKKNRSVTDSVNWDEGLINEPVKDDKWQPFVAFLVPSQCSNVNTVESLKAAVEEGTRRRFFFIEKESMLASAREDAKLSSAGSGGGGGGKKSKQGSVPVDKPLHAEVCEHVTNALNTGEQLPASLVARMLKYKILKKRKSDIMEKEAQLKEVDDSSQGTKPVKGVSAKGKGGGSAAKKGKDTPSGKGGAGDIGVDDFPMPQKPPSTMKKRGEEDLDSKYIDDEPHDGPSSYILLQGFHETEVFNNLSGIGVCADALVKINNTGPEEYQQSSGELTEEEQAELVKKSNTLAHFWYNIHQCVLSSPNGSMLRDMAQLELVLDVPPSIEDAERFKEFGQAAFSKLSHQLYNILHIKKQYQSYLNYLDTREIPLSLPLRSMITGEVEDEPVIPQLPVMDESSTVDMRYYNELLSKVPEESVTPSILLHCMVEQVELTLSRNKTIPVSDSLHCDLEKKINDIVSSLPLLKETYHEESYQTKPTLPLLPITNWQDRSQLNSLYSPSSSCVAKANKMGLERSIYNSSITIPTLTDSLSTQYQTQLHSLKHFCVDVPGLQLESIFNSLLVLLSLEHTKPPLVSDVPQNDPIFNDKPLLLDYPLNLALKQHVSSNTALVPVNTNEENIPPPNEISPPRVALDLPSSILDLSNYSVLEPLSRDVILQAIASHRLTHPHIHMYHHKLTNLLVVAMYSGYSDDLQAGKCSWSTHTHSKVGFNNYLKYVAQMVSSTVDAAVEEDIELKNAIEKEREAILEAKMKALEEKQAVEKQESESKQSSAKGGKKSGPTSAKKSPMGKKPGSGIQTPSSKEDLGLEIGLPQFKKRTLYTGYDIGDRVLLSEGSFSRVFTSDGVLVTSEKVQFVEGPISHRVSLTDCDIILSAVVRQSVNPIPPSEPQPIKTDEEEEQTSNKEVEIPNPIPQPPERVLFSAFEGSIGNNLTLSLSHYGPQGNGMLPVEPKSAKLLEKIEQSPDSSKESRPPSQQGGKLSKKQLEEQQRLLEQQQAMEIKLAKEKEEVMIKVNAEKQAIACRNKHQQLSLSTVHGLHVVCSTITDTLEDGKASVLITQEYTTSSSQTETNTLSTEASRVCLSDGSVIKHMTDKAISILCSDGTVYTTASNTSQYDALFSSDDEIFTDTQQGDVIGKTMSSTKVSFIDDLVEGKDGRSHKESPLPRETLWIVTNPDGTRHLMKYILVPQSSENHDQTENVEEANEGSEKTEGKMDDVWKIETAPLESFNTYTATDPDTKEILITREDKVMILHRPDGSIVTEHADGTRITSSSSSSPPSVTIENPFFARVTYVSTTGQCIVDLPSSIQVSCNTSGQYTLTDLNRDGFKLNISSNGKIEYQKSCNGDGTYTLHHSNESEMLTATDGSCNTYTVNLTGGIQVNKVDTSKSTHTNFQPHIFLLQPNGMGYEVCNKIQVGSVINEARQCPKNMIVEDKLVECPDVFTTVISPSISLNHPQLLPYKEQTIIPKNLQASSNGQCNNNTHKTRNGMKKRFGVGVGKAFSIGSYKPPAASKVFEKPKALKYRQFIHFESNELREALLSCVSKYVQWSLQNEEEKENLLPTKDKEQEEAAKSLLENVMHFKSVSSPLELLGLYQKAWEDKHCPTSSPPPLKKSKMSESIEKLKQEITDAEETKETIRNGIFPRYFRSRDGVEFLHSVSPDMEALASKLPLNPPKRKSLVSFHLPQETEAQNMEEKTQVSGLSTPTTFASITLGVSDIDSPPNSDHSTQFESTGSLTKLRPSNPTPIHAQGDGSPTMIRPLNPTPHKASGKHKPVEQSNNDSLNEKDYDISNGLPSPSAPIPPITPSLVYCVSGEMRRSPVDIPHSVSGGRPGEKLNAQFSTIEEPVRRKVRTSSTSLGASTRGFQVNPSHLSFGILKEGCTYSHCCVLKNIGVDTCRFKIKPPPPSTGIKVIYKPGAVVAGMSREFHVEIFALAVGASSSNEVGGIYHELEITTETSLLHLPIQACIYPSALHSHHYGMNNPLAGATKGVLLITERPTSREDLNRPLKSKITTV